MQVEIDVRVQARQRQPGSASESGPGPLAACGRGNIRRRRRSRICEETEMSATHNEVLALIVGGGPAPGINGVIAAATIEARNRGCDVVGCIDGFHWLSQ